MEKNAVQQEGKYAKSSDLDAKAGIVT